MNRDQLILKTATEIVMLRKKLSDLAFDAVESIKTIPGNEVAKRAIEVAAVQGNTIGFVGRETAGRLVLVAAQFGVPAFSAKACLCGNYGNVRQECKCAISQIRKYQQGKLFQQVKNANIIVEVDEHVMPGPSGEEGAAIKARIQKAREFISLVEKYQETADTVAMMKMAKNDLALTTAQIEVISLIGMSVMALEGSSTIVHVHHIVEAIQYAGLRRGIFLN